MVLRYFFYIFLLMAIYCNQVYCNIDDCLINSGSGLAQIHNVAQMSNPILIANNNNYHASFFYSPSKMGLKELSTSSAIVGTKFFENSYSAISFVGHPSKLFNEYTGSLHFAQRFEDNAILAFSINYSAISIENFSSYSMLSFDLAGNIKITDFLYSGFLIKNLNRAYYSKNEFVNQEVYIGMGIIPIENMSIDLDAIINLNRTSSGSIAISYLIEDLIKVRTAYRNNPAIYEFGIDIVLMDYLSINNIVNHHNIFGFTYLFGTSFKF